MELFIDDVSEKKQNKDGSWRYLGRANGLLYYFDKEVKVGDVVIGDVRESSYKDNFGKQRNSRWFKVEKIKTQVAAGQLELGTILSVIDAVLTRLPQDWKSGESIQGPRACAQIINTIVMKIAEGRITVLDAERGNSYDDEAPPPDNDDAPPWERK